MVTASYLTAELIDLSFSMMDWWVSASVYSTVRAGFGRCFLISLRLGIMFNKYQAK
jgi:hypothetical protein